jgi:heavy metal sensor kinase
MFSRKIPEIRHTLAFRLTLWYAGIFTASSFVAFLLFYLLITSVIRERTDQELLNRISNFSTLLNVQGINSVNQAAVFEAQASGVKKIFIRLLYRTGEAFSSSNMSYWQNIAVKRSAINRLLKGKRNIFETIVIPERKHKIRILYGFIGPGIIMQLGQSLEEHARLIEVFKKIFIATMAFLVVLSTLIGWFMARRAISGVEDITHTAQQISEGALEERVPVKTRGDEIDQLAMTFNQMLDRIQKLVTGIREMSDNIAHDLKSPVTRIRGLAEITLTSDPTFDEYANMAASTIEECDRLLDMINTMLVISETEAGVDKLNSERLDISGLLRDACELFRPIAEDKDILLTCDVPDRLDINGDIRMIQRMISNLLDNALKYTPANGTVRVEMQTGHGKPATIYIIDSGTGISPDDISHIFERFYRCDQSRSESGIGLGLSLARAIARAHGGDITAESIPKKGSTFTITLPL